MSICPNCNNQLDDGAKFCNHCGTPVAEMIFCPYCGQQTPADAANCPNCGASLVQAQPDATTVLEPSDATTVLSQEQYEQYAQPQYAEPQYAEPQAADTAVEAPAADPSAAPAYESAEVQSEEAPAPAKKQIPKKAIIIGAVAAAVVALVVILGVVFGGKSKVPNYALYIKDKEIFYSDFSKDPIQVTSDFVSGDIDNDELADSGEMLNYFARLAKDGKTMFFVDKLDEGDSGYSLYYRNIKKPKQEPVKIDSSVSNYTVSDDVSTVTLLTTDGVLYQYSMKKDEKEKVASDVSDFYASKDGKKLVYLNDDNKVYLKNAGKDAEAADSDVEYIKHVTEDCTKVYYIKENTLYVKAEGKDKAKIAADVDNVIKIYESGEVYYTKKNEAEIKLSDYVEDDMKSADESFVMPEYPSYPSWWDYDTNEAYEKAYAEYEKKYDAYYEAYDKQYEIEQRNRIRESLTEGTMENNSKTLCFYNGSEEKVISEVYSDYESVASESPAIIFNAYNQGEVAKVKISEISSSWDVENLVREALYSSADDYVAVKETASVIEQENADSYRISSDASVVYFLDNMNDDVDSGDLYKMAISGGKASKPELYDSDVSSILTLFENGDVLYYKDYDYGDYDGTLYINKSKVADDARMQDISGYNSLGKLMFFTDYSSKSEQGVLNVYENGKVTKIADDVHDATLLPNGNIIYLSNYSIRNYKGDLYLSKGSKAEKLDEDVVAIYKILEY